MTQLTLSPENFSNAAELQKYLDQEVNTPIMQMSFHGFNAQTFTQNPLHFEETDHHKPYYRVKFKDILPKSITISFYIPAVAKSEGFNHWVYTNAYYRIGALHLIVHVFKNPLVAQSVKQLNYAGIHNTCYKPGLPELVAWATGKYDQKTECMVDDVLPGYHTTTFYLDSLEKEFKENPDDFEINFLSVTNESYTRHVDVSEIKVNYN